MSNESDHGKKGSLPVYPFRKFTEGKTPAGPLRSTVILPNHIRFMGSQSSTYAAAVSTVKDPEIFSFFKAFAFGPQTGGSCRRSSHGLSDLSALYLSVRFSV